MLELESFSLFLCPGGVVQHAGAETHSPLRPGEDVVVRAAPASIPEHLVLREFRERDGPVAQLRIDLHHGETRRDAEYLRFRILLPGEFECLLLDSLRDTRMAVLRYDDETGIGHIFPVLPRLYVAESDETLSLRSNYGLPLLHLLTNVSRLALGDTCSPGLCSFLDDPADLFGISEMLRAGHVDRYIHL